MAASKLLCVVCVFLAMDGVLGDVNNAANVGAASQELESRKAVLEKHVGELESKVASMEQGAKLPALAQGDSASGSNGAGTMIAMVAGVGLVGAGIYSSMNQGKKDDADTDTDAATDGEKEGEGEGDKGEKEAEDDNAEKEADKEAEKEANAAENDGNAEQDGGAEAQQDAEEMFSTHGKHNNNAHHKAAAHKAALHSTAHVAHKTAQHPTHVEHAARIAHAAHNPAHHKAGAAHHATGAVHHKAAPIPAHKTHKAGAKGTHAKVSSLDKAVDDGMDMLDNLF